MIKGVIFDIDGTLIDSMPIWNDLGARYLKTKGIEPEEHLGEKLFPMTVREGVVYLKDHYQLSESTDQIQTGLNQIAENFYRYEVMLKPGVKQILDYFRKKGIPMVLCTVGMPTLANYALKRLQVDVYFKEIFVCDVYHTTKREPLIYFKAADYLKMLPKDLLVIEDVLVAVKTAKQAGFQVCAVYDQASSQDETEIRKYSDYYVHDLSELMGKEEI